MEGVKVLPGNKEKKTPRHHISDLGDFKHLTGQSPEQLFLC